MRADMCMYGVRADDVDFCNRDERGAVDLQVKSKGVRLRIFMDPDLVRMIGALAKTESDTPEPVLAR